MRSLSRSLLLGCALALLTPVSALAQDYTPSVKPLTYVPLDPTDLAVTTPTWSGNALTGFGLPFPVVYYGAVFNQINISTFGYVTFSSRPGYDELSGNRSDPGVAANQYPLPNAANPNGVIAVWWDDLRCPAGSIKTRDAVIQGSRTFTIEWNGCYREAVTTATIQAQLQFTEGSPIILVYYGQLGAGGTHNATVGIENPPRWAKDASGAWLLQAPGGTLGVTPALSPACPAGGCAGTSWPTNSVIQYGRPLAADLQAGRNATSGYLGLRIASLAGVGTVTAQLENNIENGGQTSATGVTWDYYVSTDDVLDPLTDTLLACSHTTAENVPALSIRTFGDTCTATLSPGLYRLCTYVDPPNPGHPEGLVIEANESNNAYCSPQFVVGADIAGSISLPATGEAGGTMDVSLHLENRGSDGTSSFRAEIWLQDCSTSDPAGNVLAWQTTLSLGGGASHDEVAVVPVRPDTQGVSICAVLVIDPDGSVPELDEANNLYSTCVAHGSTPRACATISRPDLRIGGLGTDLPLGCFYGETIGLNAEICNDTAVEARSFGLAFYLDINSVVTTNDTRILSLPQACQTPADCIDIGGGPPSCVEGICQAPCLVDADCGAGGLECEPSFVVPGKTCQLVLPGETCRWVSAVANVPTFDTRAGADFLDDDIYFGAIIDWTEKVEELVEGNQNKKAAERVFCWTRKPDFQTVDLRVLPVIASGETTPVFRRVRNSGAIGSAYSYRYVLSSNPTVSVNDLGLEIVGKGLVGDGVVAARSDDVRNDMIRLPAGIAPGTYYLGMILDPDDAVLELLEDNNTTVASPVQVVGASLRIVTSSLHDATVGSSYTVQLLATGGAGSYVWSLVSGSLPPGLLLEADGLLHGTVLEPGTSLFQVQVASNGNVATASFALDAALPRGPLAITLTELPPALMGSEYRASLSATGGLTPYTWECQGRPAWLSIQNNLLFGTPSAVAAPVPVTCTVTDANAARVSRSYALAVYPASGVRIRTTQLPSGDIGVPWSACVIAEGGSGNYDWSFDLGTIPAGLAFEERDNTGCLTGVPASCGSFLVGVDVTDASSGLNDTRRLDLTIFCDSIGLTTRSLPPATRGVAYEAQLETNASGPVAFELAGGELPPDLSLASDGQIFGTVAVDAPTGAHTAAVRFYDQAGGSGVGVVAIDVAADAPPGVKVINTETTGCSTSGEGPAGLLPFAALFALLGLRRRTATRSAAALASFAAALLLPAAAAAQYVPGYATYHHPKPYEPLTGASQLNPSGSNTAFIITLNGWTVPYYGESYGKLMVHENGLLLFGSNYAATTPYRIPYSPSVSSSYPRNYIAGWWDNHNMYQRPGSWLWRSRGASPSRELVFEWNFETDQTTDANAGGHFQISIFQDGTIKMRWGEIIDPGVSGSHAAVIGLMDAQATPRSVPFLDCSVYTSASGAGCTSQEWNAYLRNTEAVFTTLPNLQIRSTSTNFEGHTGLEQTYSATVYNYGPFPATAPVRFFVSADTTFSEDDIAIGTTEPVEVGAFAERTVELTAALPRELDVERYFLLAVADPDDTLKEYLDDDNAGGTYSFRVVEPRPDLAVVRLGAPSSGSPGSRLTIDLAVRNLGNLDAVDVPFAVVLSENEVISGADLALLRGTIGARWQESAEESYIATLPADVPPGLYRLGVVIDPDDTVEEFDKLNNVASAERPFVVSVGGVAILNGATWSVQVGSEFCVPLQAEGGDGEFAWSLLEGELPPGIELTTGGATGGALCGRPTAVGIFDFTIGVVSGSLAGESQMSIEVTPDHLGLSISVRELPLARFQAAYESGIVAFGGDGPYRWQLVGGTLPIGMTFDEDGLLFGVPLEAGSFSFEVQVTDSVNRTATETLSLLVVPPARVTCASRTLGTLELDEQVDARLLAAGGTVDYEWTTVSTRRLNDPRGLPIVEANPPPGLLLGVTGVVSGRPLQVGQYLWTVEVKSGSQSDICALTLDVAAEGGPVVTTIALPNAVPNLAYAVPLKASGGSGTLVWSLANGSTLPAGLALDSGGTVSGVVQPDALGDADSRTFAFEVEVRDERNLKGTGMMSLTVAPEAQGTITVVDRKVDEGCQAAGGGFGLGALALVLVALWRRR